tara:strand:+ start:1438 stop:1623 length:186 start_codon:yes stop_codon:yes gene_type:complete
VDPILEIFLERLDQIRREHQEGIADGSAPDFHTYRFLCGVLHGLNLARRDLKEIVSQVEES